MWDLGGQVHYASLLQPYIVTGSLYLLLVPVDTVPQLEAQRFELLTRWLDYLQVGAPEAVVQPVQAVAPLRTGVGGLRVQAGWMGF